MNRGTKNVKKATSWLDWLKLDSLPYSGHTKKQHWAWKSASRETPSLCRTRLVNIDTNNYMRPRIRRQNNTNKLDTLIENKRAWNMTQQMSCNPQLKQINTLRCNIIGKRVFVCFFFGFGFFFVNILQTFNLNSHSVLSCMCERTTTTFNKHHWSTNS